MRRIAVVLTAVLSLTACDAAGDLAEQAEDLSDALAYCASAAETLAAFRSGDPAQMTEAGDRFVAEAPDEIADEARTLLEAGRAAEEGDPEALATDAVRAAADTVASYTRDTCDPTQ